jgi:hypothetical protein
MRRHVLVLALLTVAMVTGCTSDPGDAPQPSDTPRTPPASDESQALGLVGLWRVSDAAGESEQTWLRLDAGSFQLWRECGMIMGSWEAGEQAFIAGAYGASGTCVDGGTIPDIPWLDSVTSYERDEAGWRLTDAAGDVVASLAIDGAPEPIDTSAEFYTEPPVINEQVRAAFRPVAALPGTLEPASDAELLGRWTPVVGSPATDPHVVFLESGTWTGSDGCNGVEGRWTTEGEGELLTTSGGTTSIGCEGAGVPYWVAGARLAGFDGAELVLLDTDGTVLGRLEPTDGLG